MTHLAQQSDSTQQPGPVCETARTEQPTAPRKGMSSGKLLAIVGASLIAALGTTGCSAAGAGKTNSASSTGAVSAAQSECSTVTSAYDKWHGDLGPITAGYKMPTGDDLDHLTANGKDFLVVVKKYSDQSSKNLAYAIATYNDAVAHAHVVLTNSGSIDNDTFMSILNSGVEINNAYHPFQAAVCGSPSGAATSN